MQNQVFSLQADLFKALANTKRLEIIHLLRNKSMCVGELRQMVSVSQPNISQHLAVLRQFGVVKTVRLGRKIYYSLAHPNFALSNDLFKEIYEKHKI